MSRSQPPFPNQALVLVDDQNPWPGLVSFNEEASAFFRGRNEEKAELFRLVTRETLSVVFGQSGLGKTSLLQAGLFPELRQADYLPVYVRLNHGSDRPSLAAQILAALQEAALRSAATLRLNEEGESLWEYFQSRDGVVTGAAGRPLTPVIVLDQFEEIFTLGRREPERVAALVDELECLVENRAPRRAQTRFEQAPDEMEKFDFDRRAFKLVLSLREDFVPELENFRNRLRGLAQNRFRLQRMNGRQALAVAFEAGHGLIDEDAARRVVENLSSEGGAGEGDLGRRVVEPALLSVVLRELNFRRQREGAPCITPEMVTVAQDILRDFYNDKMADVPLVARVALEDAVLSDSGRYRVQAALDDLAASGIPVETIEQLVNRRILRYDERYGARVVELTHDRLVPVVQVCRRQRQEDAKMLAAEEAQRAAEGQARIAAEREAKIRGQLRRSRLAVAGFAGLAVLTGLMTIWAFQERKQAESAQQQAETAQKTAETAQKHAEAAQSQARQMQSRAERVLDSARNTMAISSVELGDQLDNLDQSRAALGQQDDGARNFAESQAAFLGKAAETLYLFGDLKRGFAYAGQLRDLVAREKTPARTPAAEWAVTEAESNYLLGVGDRRMGRLAEAENLLKLCSDALALRPPASRTEKENRIVLLAGIEFAETAKDRLDFPEAKKRIQAVLADQSALKESTFGQSEEGRFLRAIALSRIGRWQVDYEIMHAPPQLEAAGEILDSLATKQPLNLRYKTALTEVLLAQGRLAWHQGHVAEATDYFRQVAETCDRLIEIDDHNLVWLQLRARCNLAQALTEVRRDAREAAQKFFATAEAQALEVTRRQPDDGDVKILQATTQLWLGRMPDYRFETDWLNQNQATGPYLPMAAQRFQEAGRTLDSLVTPSNEISEARLIQLEARLHYADFKRFRGQKETGLNEGLDGIAKLKGGAPDDLRVLELECMSVRMLSLAEGAQKQEDQAMVNVTKARELAAAGARRVSTTDWYRMFLDDYYAEGGKLEQMGKVDEAGKILDDAIAAARGIFEQDPQNQVVGEWLLSLQLRKSQWHLTRNEWPKAVELLGDAFRLALSRVKLDASTNRLSKRLADTLRPEAVRYQKLLREQPAPSKELLAKLADLISPRREYPLSPLVPGAWEELGPDDRTANLAAVWHWLDEVGKMNPKRLAAFAPQLADLKPLLQGQVKNGQRITRMRRLKLSFYDDATLYEAEVERPGHAAGLLTYIFFHKKAGATQETNNADSVKVDTTSTGVLHYEGQSASITALNTELGVSLKTHAQVQDYLRFFFTGVRAGEGGVRIVETPQEIGFFAELSQAQRASWVAKMRPLVIEDASDGTWRVSATIAYADVLYNTNFVLQPTGVVGKMENDRIASDLPILRDIFSPEYREIRSVEDLSFAYRVKSLLKGKRWQWRTAVSVLKERDADDRSKPFYEVLASVQLYLRDYVDALVSTELGLNLIKKSTDKNPDAALWSKRAHTLLLMGRGEEAAAIYFDPRNIALSGDELNQASWAALITSEFAELRERGIDHEKFDSIQLRVTQAVKDYQAAAKLKAEEKEKADRALSDRNKAHLNELENKVTAIFRDKKWTQAVTDQKAVIDFVLKNYPVEAERNETAAWEYARLAWFQLFARDFDGAVQSTDAGLKLHQYWLMLDTNRGLALLMLGRFEEAEKALLSHRKKGLSDLVRDNWDDRTLKNFAELEKEGVTSPDVARITQALAAGAEAARNLEKTSGERLDAWATEIKQLTADKKWSEAVTARLAKLDYRLKYRLVTNAEVTSRKGDYLGLSWSQLHTRDFAGALVSAETGLKLDQHYLPLETNRAHALLFLGRTEEARKLYLSHVGTKITEMNEKLWEDVVIADFDDLEKDGVPNPEFAALRVLLRPAKPAPVAAAP